MSSGQIRNTENETWIFLSWKHLKQNYLKHTQWKNVCCLKTATGLPMCETSNHMLTTVSSCFLLIPVLLFILSFLPSFLSCLGLYRLWALGWNDCLILVFLWCLALMSELVFYTTVTMQPLKVNYCTDHSTELDKYLY